MGSEGEVVGGVSKGADQEGEKRKRKTLFGIIRLRFAC